MKSLRSAGHPGADNPTPPERFRRADWRASIGVAVVAAALVAGILSPTRASAAFGGWTHVSPANSPSARSGASMYNDDPRGDMLLFGGRDASGLRNDTWTWDGTNWTLLTPANSPPAREFASMALDDTHQTLVLFGGRGASGVLNDTWTWDGTTWTQQAPVNSPPAREGASLAGMDIGSNILVLFGGETPTLLNDTWVWDGTALTWTQRSPATSPPARAFASMAFADNGAANVVLFGGLGAAGARNDTWTWNQTTWTQASPSVNPPARDAASITMDDTSGLMVLFGGANGATALNDTWTWNNTSWTKQSPAVSPSPRQGAPMGSNDSGAGVLFGGSGPGPLGDTWIWVSSTGTATATTVTSSLNPSTVGGSVTFTATVVPGPTGGTVEFDDNGTAIAGCTAAALAAATATCTSTLSVAGNHDIVANYSGDATSLASSGALVQAVNPATTTTSVVTSSPNPAAARATVTYSVTISPAVDGGTVAFADAGATIPGCGAVAILSGQATCSVVYPVAGSHLITASYSGDANYTASTAPRALSQSVLAAVPTPEVGAGGGITLLPWALLLGGATVALAGRRRKSRRSF
jgi:hypothetical protein